MPKEKFKAVNSVFGVRVSVRTLSTTAVEVAEFLWPPTFGSFFVAGTCKPVGWIRMERLFASEVGWGGGWGSSSRMDPKSKTNLCKGKD